MMMMDDRPVTMERVQEGLHGSLPLRVVHRDYPAIRGRVVAWSNMETDVCGVDVGMDGVMEPVVIRRRYLLEYFDEDSGSGATSYEPLES